MSNDGFITYLFETMLREVFFTKSNMARTLDVTKRALQYNFKGLECRKGGSVACENLFLYCLEHDLLEVLYDRYLSESGSLKGGRKQVGRLPMFHLQPYGFAA